MSVGPLTALTLVPRNVALRAVVVFGLLLPWVWLAALDRALRRKD